MKTIKETSSLSRFSFALTFQKTKIRKLEGKWRASHFHVLLFLLCQYLRILGEKSTRNKQTSKKVDLFISFLFHVSSCVNRIFNFILESRKFLSIKYSLEHQNMTEKHRKYKISIQAAGYETKAACQFIGNLNLIDYHDSLFETKNVKPAAVFLTFRLPWL